MPMIPDPIATIVAATWAVDRALAHLRDELRTGQLEVAYSVQAEKVFRAWRDIYALMVEEVIKRRRNGPENTRIDRFAIPRNAI